MGVDALIPGTLSPALFSEAFSLYKYKMNEAIYCHLANFLSFLRTALDGRMIFECNSAYSHTMTISHSMILQFSVPG